MTTTAPLVDPRTIALAHYAARAVLERVLARHGTTFQQNVTLRLVAVADAPVERATLVDGVTGALKVHAADAHGTIDELIAAGLLVAAEGSRVDITDAGRELYAKASADTAPVTARIYAGISEEDRAVTGRVLTLIKERADTELAALETRQS
ncbi:MarR family transcriptional regulator [Streptomyces barringtoniae]|uniref:MarR family transcriptional regulator n=1 Tax=Streptomyces barringtoniae TaxID=2892029 RepID=UPI001E4DF3F0|nr:MarR family transcriptional regulator [Streptomyces barringtoniae]MCC5475742.1 MarR family transcriptional regulator [Streptomyces barringtoniae]